jgi:preprotein translocase subunit SecG
MMILAKLTGLQLFLALLLIAVCVTLMVIILLQRGRGGGISAAFGGGGGGSAFGAKTGDVFTLFTVILAAVYLLIAVVGNYMFLPPPGLEAARPGQVRAPAGDGDRPPTGQVPSQPPVTRVPAGDTADEGAAGGATAGEEQTEPADQADSPGADLPPVDQPVEADEPEPAGETTQ